MISATTLNYIDYYESLHLPKEQGIRLIAILFCRPELELMRTDILPSLPYFHFRSGGNTAFYFAGFELDQDDDIWGIGALNETGKVDLESNEGVVASITKQHGELKSDEQSFFTVIATMKYDADRYFKSWHFVPRSFNQLRADIERVTKWKYSGGCDMILFNSRFDESCKHVTLDFTSAIAIGLDRIQDITSTPSVSALFEEIFQYAEKQSSSDPVTGLSNYLGVRILKTSIWDIILGVVPKNFRNTIIAAKHVVVRDISIDTA